MLSLLATLLIYTENGNQYDTSEKKVLMLVEEKTVNIQIPETVQNIKAGSISTSAFNLCKNNIKSVSFKPNSELIKFGAMLFAETSVETVDFSNCNNLKRIEDGCCLLCSCLTKLILPPNVYFIGSGAIQSPVLQNLDFPDSLHEISSWTSTYGTPIKCPKLKSVKISAKSNLTRIGIHGFLECGLESFFIPQKLSSFGIAVFVNCPIKQFSVDPNNEQFSTDGITVYNKEGTIIEFVSSYNTGINYTVKSSVTLIKDQAFRGTPTETIIFENQDLQLSKGCFAYSKVKELTLPTGALSVSNTCLAYSTIRRVVLPQNITEISSSAFMGCSSLTEVVMSPNIINISSGAFNGCTSLSKIEIPESVVNIEAGAFSGCSSRLVLDIKNKTRFNFVNNILYCDNVFVDYISDSDDYDIVIPKNVESVIDGMFQGKKLNSLTFENGSLCTTIRLSAFKSSSIKTVTFPPMLESLRKDAFRECKRLETVNFDGVVDFIEQSAFHGCISLKTINFKESNQLKVIGKNAFDGCTSLTNFDFLELTKLHTIKENAFYNTGLTVANFAENLTTIESSAFKKSKLQTLNFNNANVSLIQSYSFSCCSSLNHIEFSPITQEIGIYAFSECTSLTSVCLGTSISVINRYAFSYSSILSEVVLPEGSQLKSIMGNAFFETSLSNFNIKDPKQFSFKKGLLMNGNFTNLIYFISKKDVFSVILPSSIVSIDAFAFQNANYIREVIIPDGNFQKIGYASFQGCTQLRRVSLPDTLTDIEEDAFDGCNKILCGGLSINEEFVASKKDYLKEKVGFPERALSDGCRNNFKPLMIKKTCGHNPIKPRVMCLLFLFSIL